MATRERYARASVSMSGMECTPGLELRKGDDATEVMGFVHATAFVALAEGYPFHTQVCDSVERLFTEHYPGRAFFIETEEDGKGVQVYQPFGMPRAS